MKKVQPLGINVLVKIAGVEEVTEGGIIIPDTASKEKPQEGEIIAVGDDKSLHKSLKAGVKVLFKKYSGSEIELDGAEHVILNGKEDILGVIE